MKRGIRAVLLKKRDNIKAVEKSNKEKAISKTLFALTEFRKAGTILFYASFRSEVTTMQIIKEALDMNKKIALPVVENEKKELRLYRINDLSELESGYMGILEPSVRINRKITLRDIDLVIIPGAGFDEKGNRLGYGHGFYDKLLSKKSLRTSNSMKHYTTVALAFEEQMIPKVPEDVHDVRVDKIITEKRVIDCKTEKGVEGSRGRGSK
ncbi:MAG: 5-formyltetrahydrofolate cyclo-ligase [Nitrospirae bacterium]|nr:5-formyltetrahydrofolate cyclo-ligase [Nitrospirota bacterium]